MSDLKLPVMLIHGFRGTLEDWTSDTALRAALVQRGLDPRLVHVFHYGFRDSESAEPVYNNEGDIRQIASRLTLRDSEALEDLDSQVDRLSDESVAAGGPPGVTLICHSMGGLVARYYLSRHQPDEFGTHYRSKVSRLIQIGSPNLGVDLLQIVPLIPEDSFIWKIVGWIERLPFVQGSPRQALESAQQQVIALQTLAREEQFGITTRGFADSPAIRQLAPGSPFLAELNRTPPPRGLRCYCLYGDIRYGLHIRWGPLLLWSRSLSLGDLIIPAYSAQTIPGIPVSAHPFRSGHEWTIHIPHPDELVTTKDISTYLPPTSHSHLLRNPQVHDTIWSILHQ
jgi:pimeloyl-ACP methyl ester carboxylesterase